MRRLGASKLGGSFLGKQNNSSASDAESLEESGKFVSEMAQEGSVSSGEAETMEVDFPHSSLARSPKRPSPRVAEGALPISRLGADVRSEVEIQCDGGQFRDRFAIAPFQSTGGQTPHVTTQADLEAAVLNPKEGRLEYHISFPMSAPPVVPLPIPLLALPSMEFPLTMFLYLRMPIRFLGPS